MNKDEPLDALSFHAIQYLLVYGFFGSICIFYQIAQLELIELKVEVSRDFLYLVSLFALFVGNMGSIYAMRWVFHASVFSSVLFIG